MKIAIAQINPTLGDFSANSKKILDYTFRAQQSSADLVIFPECALFGYHPFDLLERPHVVHEEMAELKKIIKAMPSGISALVGVIVPRKEKTGRPYYNSAALIQKGKAPRFFHKELLPTGDVFDEQRFIEPGQLKDNFFQIKGHKILLTICEDIWAWSDSRGRSVYKKNPLLQKFSKKPDIVLNMSASPFYFGKLKVRQELVRKTCKRFKAPMIYVNMVGAQDEIIYDGQSFALSASGQKILQAKAFAEDLQLFDLERSNKIKKSQSFTEADSLRAGLVLGIKDFCVKAGLTRAHLGLSGGIDSAVVACLAVEALGADNVTAFFLEGPFSSQESRELAEQMAKALKIKWVDFPISNLYEVFKKELRDRMNIHGFSLTHENLQARLRGIALMAFANDQQSLLLSTSNKAEYATGYSTLYGDMCGGLAPIGDLTKQKVVLLAELFNKDKEVIPQRIITRPPTAELRQNQRDEDSLPKYRDLDNTVEHLIERAGSVRHDVDRWVLNQIFKTEFKRWQAPPILKVTPHAFGRGRRWPIAHRYKQKF